MHPSVPTILETSRLVIRGRDIGGQRLQLEAYQKEPDRTWPDRTLDFKNVEPVAVGTYDYNVEKGSVYLNRMDANRRNRGFGREMLAAVLEHFRERGFRWIEGYIESTNFDSQKMVEKLGFTRTREMRYGDMWGRQLATYADKKASVAEIPRGPRRKIDKDTKITGWKEYQKTKPIEAVRMDEPFAVETLEGVMKGKKGDWLAQGIEGERWVIDTDIFDKTYKPVPAKKASATDGRKTGDRTGVGFFIPLAPALARPFPDKGPKDRSAAHTTFLYVGAVPAAREAAFLAAAGEALATVRGPVRGHLEGPTYFEQPGQGRIAVMTIRFDRDLAALRWILRDRLLAAGFAVDDSFPLIYRPHVTLQYMDDPDSPYTGRVPAGSWSFGGIEVWGLPRVHTVPFGPVMAREAAKYNPFRQPLPWEPAQYDLTGYHATPIGNWPSIRRRGLIPGYAPPGGQTWLGDYSGKAIYYHLQFPAHEIDNGYDPETGEPGVVVVETRFRISPGYVVPDEEAGRPEETPEIVRTHGPVVVAIRIPPDNITALHLPDTPAARTWARTARARRVEFHNVGFRARDRVVARWFGERR